jgi:hypothetical protein
MVSKTVALETINVGQLTDIVQIRKYMLAGNATITIRSLATGTRFTYKIKQKVDKETNQRQDFWFVSLLNGADNESDYAYLGTVHTSQMGGSLHQVYKHGVKSKIGYNAPSAIAFEWVARQLWEITTSIGQSNLSAGTEIWHEGKCGRCNRALTVPESIESGFGPECINYV